MKSTHEVLVAARNLIEREGWARTSWSSEGRCAMTALGDVAGVNPLTVGEYRIPHYYWLAQEPACQVLAEVVGTEPRRIWSFNDKYGRTKAEVLAAFDEAIRRTAPEPQDPFTEDEDFAHSADAVAIP